MQFLRKKLNIKKFDLCAVVLLLLIAYFFRLWKLKSLQYWSDDEQLIWAIIRHIIVDKHLSLVIPNAAIEMSLGPLFHYLVFPWFWLVNLDPEKILLLGNIFTFFGIILMFIAGNLIGGKKVGFIAAFLYSVSFISSLFDRRLWALSPNIALVLLGIISLIQILKGKSKYIILLVVPLVFSVNSDPSLGVIALTTLLIFAIFKPKIRKKHIAQAFLLSFFLLLPLLVFEFRHNGQNIRSIQHVISESVTANKVSKVKFGTLFYSQLEYFTRFFYTKDSKAADAYFCYCKLDDKPLPILVIGFFLILTGFVVITLKEKNKSCAVLLIIVISYLLGIYIFKTYLGGNPAFFYSMTISPVLFLITAIIIARSKKLTFILLPIVFLTNLYTLSQSSFKYPLSDKMKVIHETILNIPDKNRFSLYYSGDILMAGGGWTSLFMTKGYIPVKSSLSEYWGHIYESYNLYPIPFSREEPETVVVLSDTPSDTLNIGNIYSTIYDNSEKWFHPKINLEKLSQPKYFK